MSQSLNRLADYLESNNYQAALTIYDRQRLDVSYLEPEKLITLAKAFFALQKYEEAIKLIEKIKNPQNQPIKVLYESQILIYKAKYLLGMKVDGNLNDIVSHLQKNYPNGPHLLVVKELQKIVERDNSLQKSKIQNREYLRSQYKSFLDIYEKEDKYERLQQGIPAFLVSARWFENWENYTNNKEKQYQHPGPISQLQILDHPYYFFYDSNSQKFYTNYFLLKTNRYKIFSKKCWEFLNNRYRGIQIKRWNIMANDRSLQIITEINLKEIEIYSEKIQTPLMVQITKKQTWKGLIKKISKQWGENGSIIEVKMQQKIPVDENQVLEDVDTVGKKYFYTFQNLKVKNKSDALSQLECAYCKKKQNLKFCQCKIVKYCDINCLKNHWENHRKACQLAMQHLKQKSAVLQHFNLSQRSYGGRKGVVGLRNLGNTCYMNSGLQCLSNTRELTQYFMSNKFMEDINHNNPLGTKGHLACAYAQVIRQLWTERDEVISPFNLKKMIGKFAAQFSGYGQQDSQEFISYLIDGLQEDLNLVKKKQTFQTNDEVRPDQQASRQSQLNYAKRIQSFIRDLMVGQFKSTVLCLTCRKISVCFDPFMLISLPIPTLPEGALFYVPYSPSQSIYKVSFILKPNLHMDELNEGLRMYFKKKKLIMMILIIDPKTLKILRQIKDKEEVLFNDIYHLHKSDYIFCYEFPEEYNRSQIVRLDYYLSNSLISFPRYSYIRKGTSRQQIIKIVAQSFSRYLQREDPIRYIDGELNIQGEGSEKLIKVNLKKDPNMLKYTQKRQYKLFESDEKKIMSLNDCFVNYSQRQLLEKENEWYCNNCKQFKPAQKHMQVYKSNKILVLAFKRFNRFRKTKAYIQFPIVGLDMGPFLKSNIEKKKIMYDLYGVVNHFGSLGGGHYTAFCQNFLNQKWYQFNDSRVSEITPKEIVNEDAYVLFYRRRD